MFKLWTSKMLCPNFKIDGKPTHNFVLVDKELGAV